MNLSQFILCFYVVLNLTWIICCKKIGLQRQARELVLEMLLEGFFWAKTDPSIINSQELGSVFI